MSLDSLSSASSTDIQQDTRKPANKIIDVQLTENEEETSSDESENTDLDDDTDTDDVTDTTNENQFRKPVNRIEHAI